MTAPGPVLAWEHVVAALEAVGDPGNTAATLGPGTGEDMTLFLVLPSAGSAMVFAAALTAQLVIAAIDDNENVDQPGAAADEVAEIMARASNTYDTSLAEGKEPGALIVYLPGVRITGYPHPAPVPAEAASLVTRMDLEEKAVTLIRDVIRATLRGQVPDAAFTGRVAALIQQAWQGGRWQAAEELAAAWSLHLDGEDLDVMRDALTGILPAGWTAPEGAPW